VGVVDDLHIDGEADTAGDESRGWSTSAKVQVTLLVVNVAFWTALLGWTLAGDHGAPPDRLDDPAFAAAAEPICAETVTRIDALGLPTEVESPQERAELVEAENVLLLAMVADLEALPRPTGEQGEWVDTWLVDWNAHIDDRQRWADDLQVGDDHVFIETARGNEHVSNVIDNFADVNDMDSCATPGDV
jgi:hypothetical protein